MALGSSVLQRQRASERFVRFSCLQLFQDNPIGDWDGVIDGKLLCNFASLEHTRLVPICDVMPGESPSIDPSFFTTCMSLSFSENIQLFLSPTSTELLPSIQSLCFSHSGNREAFVMMVHLFLKVKWDTQALCFPHWHIDLFMCTIAASLTILTSIQEILKIGVFNLANLWTGFTKNMLSLIRPLWMSTPKHNVLLVTALSS